MAHYQKEISTADAEMKEIHKTSHRCVCDAHHLGRLHWQTQRGAQMIEITVRVSLCFVNYPICVKTI